MFPALARRCHAPASCARPRHMPQRRMLSSCPAPYEASQVQTPCSLSKIGRLAPTAARHHRAGAHRALPCLTWKFLGRKALLPGSLLGQHLSSHGTPKSVLSSLTAPSTTEELLCAPPHRPGCTLGARENSHISSYFVLYLVRLCQILCILII